MTNHFNQNDTTVALDIHGFYSGIVDSKDSVGVIFKHLQTVLDMLRDVPSQLVGVRVVQGDQQAFNRALAANIFQQNTAIQEEWASALLAANRYNTTLETLKGNQKEVLQVLQNKQSNLPGSAVGHVFNTCKGFANHLANWEHFLKALMGLRKHLMDLRDLHVKMRTMLYPHQPWMDQTPPDNGGGGGTFGSGEGSSVGRGMGGVGRG
jgi:hypothetical protein